MPTTAPFDAAARRRGEVVSLDHVVTEYTLMELQREDIGLTGAETPSLKFAQRFTYVLTA